MPQIGSKSGIIMDERLLTIDMDRLFTTAGITNRTQLRAFIQSGTIPAGGTMTFGLAVGIERALRAIMVAGVRFVGESEDVWLAAGDSG
jgi:hypothetical protein